MTPMADGGAFVRALARGAGLPESALQSRNPEELAELLGMLMRIVVENLRQLLQARVEAKRVARASQQTMLQAVDNNPLKFSPTTEDALRILFGPPHPSYLDTARAFQQGFGDIKSHQIQTFAAMQSALVMLLQEFNPEEIEREVSQGWHIPFRGKARAWKAYMERWQEAGGETEAGLVEAFMRYFSECYGGGGRGR